MHSRACLRGSHGTPWGRAMRIASDEGDGILLRDGLKVSRGLSPRGITSTGPGDVQGEREVQLVARVALHPWTITHLLVSVISAVNSLSAVAKSCKTLPQKSLADGQGRKAENQRLETVRRPKRGKWKLMIGWSRNNVSSVK